MEVSIHSVAIFAQALGSHPFGNRTQRTATQSLAMSSEDEVVLDTRATAAYPRGRPGMESLLHQPGPAILVGVVASGSARWAAELAAPNAEARVVRALLQQVLGAGETSFRPAHDSARVIGVAALVSWEYVWEKASSHATHTLMAASATFGQMARRVLPHFLEHRVLAAAILEEPVPIWAPTPGSWSAVLDPSIAVAVASRPALLTAGPSSGYRMPASQALSLAGPAASKQPRPPSRPGQPGHLWPLH